RNVTRHTAGRSSVSGLFLHSELVRICHHPHLMDSALIHFPPMGVYETLFKFLDATGKYMGTEGTHPWAQGFPLTSQIPGGPEIPTTISFSHADLKYPPATGGMELLAAIRDYYN